MATFEPQAGCAAVDRLYRTLIGTHSTLAAALMASAVTGEWPLDDIIAAGPLPDPR